MRLYFIGISEQTIVDLDAFFCCLKIALVEELFVKLQSIRVGACGRGRRGYDVDSDW